MESEVKPNAFTQSGNDFVLLALARKEDINITKGVPFYGDCFDLSFDISAFVVAISLFANKDCMGIFVQFPTRLFKCERLRFFDLAELWGSCTNLVLQVPKEQFVPLVNAAGNVLQSLRANFSQIRKSWLLFDFCQVLLQCVHIQRLMEQAIIPFMEGDAMVVC